MTSMENPVARRILAHLTQERSAQQANHIADAISESAPRVRYWLARLVDEGRAISVAFADSKCPCCSQRLSRALRVYTIPEQSTHRVAAAPAAAPFPNTLREVPSPDEHRKAGNA